MPFPNEHAARLVDPGQFDTFRRENDKGGSGVDFIYGIKGDVSTLQAVRFDKERFTEEQAKTWLKDHDHTAKMFEAAGRSDEDDKDFDRVARFDVGEIRTDVRRTDEGYLVADATVSRIGVFPYRNPDGTIRRELRHPDDVLRVDSLATLKLKPLTNGHPPTRLLNTKTARKFQVGTVGENVRSDTGLIKANITVTDEGAISDIETRGRKFLSCGYTCDLVKEDGVHEGEPFTHRQTNVRYNHVALCDTPRAGTVARLNIDHLDGEDAEVVVDRNDSTDHNNQSQRKGRFMAHIVLDGITYESDQQVINELERVRGQNTELSTKLDTVEADRDTMKSELDSTKAKLDEAENRDIAAEVAAGVKARASLVTAASPHLDEADVEKLDDLSDKDIKVAVIKKKSPDANLDDKSDAYIDARFDAVIELLKDAKTDNADDGAGSLANQRKKVHGDGKRTDGSNEPDQTKARNDMAERVANAWKEDGK